MIQLATGINANELMETTVFPNPAAGELNIRSVSGEREILLFNPEGKLLVERRLTTGLNRIDVSGFVPGLYILRIQTCENVDYRKVVIK